MIFGNFCTDPSHNLSRGVDVASYATDLALVDRSNASPPMKALMNGTLAVAGDGTGAMFPTTVVRAWMTSTNSALVSAILQMRAHSECSVEILKSLGGG